MKKKLLEFGNRNVAFWINFLLLLLLVLNIIVFLIYRTSHPSENLWTQLWVYFESDAFKVITVSLILPILLFLLENRFKIVATFEKNRKERLRKEEEQHKERRWECIERTAQTWNELYSLITKVRYIKAGAHEGASIEDILQRIENFSNSAEDIVNMWSFRFPNIYEAKKNEAEKNEVDKVFLVFFNIILKSANTVACFIQEGKKTEEIPKLQDSLESIQGGIKSIAHHNILSILKLSSDLLGSGLPQDRELSIKSRLRSLLDSLKDQAVKLTRMEREYNKIFPHIEGSEVEAFREEFKRVEEWKRENPGKQLDEYNGSKNFKKLFYKIPCGKRASARKIPYSLEYIRYLADYLAFQSTRQDLE